MIDITSILQLAPPYDLGPSQNAGIGGTVAMAAVYVPEGKQEMTYVPAAEQLTVKVTS